MCQLLLQDLDRIGGVESDDCLLLADHEDGEWLRQREGGWRELGRRSDRFIGPGRIIAHILDRDILHVVSLRHRRVHRLKVLPDQRSKVDCLGRGGCGVHESGSHLLRKRLRHHTIDHRRIGCPCTGDHFAIERVWAKHAGTRFLSTTTDPAERGRDQVDDVIEAEQRQPVVEHRECDYLPSSAKMANVDDLAVLHGDAGENESIVADIGRTGGNKCRANAIQRCCEHELRQRIDNTLQLVDVVVGTVG